MFDKLIMLFLVNVPFQVVAAHAVHHHFEIIGFARLAFDGGRHGLGRPAMGLVPVVHALLHRQRDDVRAPVESANQRADFEAGAAVTAARQFGSGEDGGSVLRLAVNPIPAKARPVVPAAPTRMKSRRVSP